MMKRIFAVLLACALVFTGLPMSAHAAECYGYEVVVSPEPVAIGSEVTLTLRLTDYNKKKSPLLGFQIDITDAENVLQGAVCTSLVSDKENLLSDEAKYQPSRDIVRHLYAKMTGSMDYAVTDLLEVRFTIPETYTEAGTLSLPLRILMQNEAGDELTYKDTIEIHYDLASIVNAPKLHITADRTEIIGGESLQLAASIEPEDAAMPELVWSIPEECAHLGEVSQDGLVTTYATREQAELTVTLAAADGSCKRAQLTLTILPELQICSDKGKEPATQLLSNKSASYRLLDTTSGKLLATKLVKWSLRPQDAAVASVNSSGKLTAKTVYERRTVLLTAQVVGEEDIRYTLAVELLPVTTQLEIFQEEAHVQTTLPLAHGDTIELRAVSYPEDAMGIVTWTSSNKKVADVSPEGVVTGGTKAGTATITATATDGSNKKATVKVEVGTMVEEVTVTAPAATVRSGKTLQLSAATAPVKKSVTWKVDNTQAASVSGSGKLTAKTVYEPTEVLVTATAKDAAASFGTYAVTILPKDDQMLVIRAGEANVTNATLNCDIADAIVLKAFTGETEETVTWTSGNTKIAKFEQEDGTLTLLKTGKATIKATCGKRTAKVTVNVTSHVQQILVSSQNDQSSLASGKSMKLLAQVLPQNATSKAVSWEIVEGSQWATISSSGTLKANTGLARAQTVKVQAVAKDGSGVRSESFQVELLPLAVGMTLFKGAEITSAQMNWDIQDGNLELAARVYPRNALQDITWSSSNKKVATVEDGVVTPLKTGTVTITAAAKDGSNRKCSVKLTILKRITGLSLEDQVLGTGKSVNLAKLIQITPSDTTTKKLTWQIVEGSEYATLTTSGTLKAKKVTQQQTLRVRATAQDDGACFTDCIVTLYPAAVTRVHILHGETEVTGKTVTIDTTQTLELDHSVTPEGAADKVTWSSGNSAIATVTSTGTVTPHKTGRVTITCAAMDGSGRKSSVSVTVVKKMVSLTLPEKAILAGGRSLTLKAGIQDADTTNKKLTWSMTGDTAYARLSSSGVVTAKTVDSEKVVYVTATAQDGSGKTATCEVHIYPATSKVRLMENGQEVTGKTLKAKPGDTLDLSAVSEPTGTAGIYTWKSSSEAYAAVADGNVTVSETAAGKTVTITCTANDGTGRKATVKISISK